MYFKVVGLSGDSKYESNNFGVGGDEISSIEFRINSESKFEN